MPAFKPPGQCPACGEWVRRGELACDCCGACERSGWRAESDVYDGVDLPDEDFNYDDFIAKEFGEGSAKRSMKNVWWWVGVILAIAFGLMLSAPLWQR